MSQPVPRPPFVKPTTAVFVEPKRRRKIHAFVDESGDRNTGASRQSDFFTMTAVLVADESLVDMKVAMAGLRSVFNVTGALHWKEHCRPRSTPRRDLVTRTLARLPGLVTVHVVLDKTRLKPNAYSRSDPEALYHWVSKFLIERIAHATENWNGGPRSALVRFSSVGV